MSVEPGEATEAPVLLTDRGWAEHAAPPREVSVSCMCQHYSGKQCRKLLPQIPLAQKEKAVIEVETPTKPSRTSEPQPKGSKKTKALQDVDMEDPEEES